MLRLTITCVCCFALASSTYADFPKLFNTEPVDDVSLVPADEAASKIRLPQGFKATAFAAEPDVQNPIAMSWDSRGRLWIAENYTYAERKQRFQLDLRDRVVIFDNTSEDQFKKRVVFTDKLQMLTGLEVGHDGLWVMCPPKLIFIPDRNHDDIPDSDGEVVLDGFEVAEQNYHNFANGLRFGPDGWLYGRCGGSCPGRIGLPGAPDHQRLAMEGGMWRYHPTRKLVEVLTTGTTNPWGHDWNGVGELFFVNTVNGHLWHMIPGAHFTRPFTLDPNRRTYELIDFHADHWHFDTGQKWTDSRDGAANSYGGGHAHSGTMIYQGDNWPDQYRGKLFTLNFHGRRANQETLDREGSGYVARHNDDLFISDDTWFRGMELSSGPDGGVFVLDWSDAGECHEHTGVHRTSGRVFKIQFGETDTTDTTDIRDWTIDALVRGHSSANQWIVRQCRLELARRSALGDELTGAVTGLRQMFEDSEGDSRQLVQSLLSLHISGGANTDWLCTLLAHDDPYVRTWAIRLLTETWTLDDTLGPGFAEDVRRDGIRKESSYLLPRFVEMAQNDSSGLVRLTLASTLQRLPVDQRSSLAAALAARSEDADDHNLPLLIWYGLMAVADERPADLVQVADVCEIPITLRLISRCLAEQIETFPQGVDELLRVAIDRPEDRAIVLQGISEGLKGWRRAPKPQNWERFAAAATKDTSGMITELGAVFGDGRAMNDLKMIAMGELESKPESRLAALETIIQSRPDDLREICESLLNDGRMNVLAARGLSTINDPKIGQAIVSQYRRFRGPYRPQIVSILVSRPTFARALIGAIADGKIPRDDLTAYQVRQIHSFGDKTLSDKVREVWGEVRETPLEKQQQIESLKARFSESNNANLRAGRALFVKHCQNCHRLYGEGEKIGPDLTGGNRSNLDYLLSNIIDPSGVVDKDFRMSLLLIDDGRTLSGLVIDESERTITMQTATEKLTVDKGSVQSRKVTEKSPMPDGLLDTLSNDQIRDLISYLRHPSQVEVQQQQ